MPVSLGLLFEHGGPDTRGAAMGAYNLAFNGGAATGALLATGATLVGPGYPLAIDVCAFAPLLVLPAVMRIDRGVADWGPCVMSHSSGPVD